MVPARTDDVGVAAPVHHGSVVAVEAWFLGGPVDRRIMPVEATAEGALPSVMRLPQVGLYVGGSEVAAPALEHVYVLSDRIDGMEVYRYQLTDEALADGD